MKKTRKTIVTGRSIFLFGIPPNIASGGAKGPLPCFWDNSGTGVGAAPDAFEEAGAVAAALWGDSVAESVFESDLLDDGLSRLGVGTRVVGVVAVDSIAGVAAMPPGVGVTDIKMDWVIVSVALIVEILAGADSIMVEINETVDIDAAGAGRTDALIVLAEVIGIMVLGWTVAVTVVTDTDFDGVTPILRYPLREMLSSSICPSLERSPVQKFPPSD
jgi:hypothetical protein